MIYGALIDSTCRVLQESCTRQGACLLYDHDSFRFRLHILLFCSQLATVSLKAVALYLGCRREKEVTDANISIALPDDSAADCKRVVAPSGSDSEDGQLNPEKEAMI